jgi:hypothetical protein
MHAFHVAVTVAMAMCGIGALIAIYWPVPNLLALSFYLGLWALMAAIIIALMLALILIVRAVNKEAKPFLRRTWLGLANGTIAVVFLAWFLAYVS